MAKMAVEAYGLKLDETAAVSFTDNNGWGKSYVEILASLGVVEGVSASKFNPNGNVTRAESVVFVQRTEVPSVRKEVAKKTSFLN
ncbi:S-layer homology domain-containing protein [Anaerobacillus sp. HL2]|nr:S-layer homology domain-containing protein [Anaerobacillus sp. HL2]